MPPEKEYILAMPELLPKDGGTNFTFEAVAAPATEPIKPAPMTRFNSGKHRLTLVPASLEKYTAAVLEYGAIKYDTNNWRKGCNWTEALDSLKRHYDAFREGEDNDPESGLPHLCHLAFNVMILIEFFDKGLGIDDRFRYDHPVGPGRILTFRQPPPRPAEASH